MGADVPSEVDYLRLKLRALEAAIADAECFADIYPEWQLVLLRERRKDLMEALDRLKDAAQPDDTG